MPQPTALTGDVCEDGRDLFVVAATGGGRAVLVPVVWHNMPPMRHDVRLRDPEALLAMGLRPDGRFLARPAELHTAPIGAWRRRGLMPAELLAMVQRGVKREAMDRNVEGRRWRAAA